MALSPLGIALMMQAPGAQARPGTVAPTDTLGAYNLTANMAEQQYQAKLQQQNALWGGLAGIGSAGIIGASKIPAIQNAVGSWLGAAPAAAPGTIGAAATDYAANPILSSADFSSLLGAGAPSLWGAGAAADAGAGSVASGIATDTALAGGADAAAGGGAAAAGMSLADLIPFLFA